MMPGEPSAGFDRVAQQPGIGRGEQALCKLSRTQRRKRDACATFEVKTHRSLSPDCCSVTLNPRSWHSQAAPFCGTRDTQL
jgi:hypothetical protein